MPEPTQPERPTITFHLIKGPHFESHKVDGALGNFAPGGISLSFFVERAAIPQTVTHELNPDGSLGNPIGATGKEGMVREIQTGVTMDLDTAKGLMAQIGKLVERANKEGAE